MLDIMGISANINTFEPKTKACAFTVVERE